MTIERTRQIFGTKMADWTDEQVRQFNEKMDTIIDPLFNAAVMELTDKKKSAHTKDR